MWEFFMIHGHEVMTHKKNTTFQFVVVRVGREEHIWEELLKAVSSIAWPVFYVRSY